MRAEGPRPTRRAERTWALVRVLAAREFRIRRRQSAWDTAWSLVTPVVVLVVYGVVITQVFGVEDHGVPYLSLVWTGMVVWTMFATAVGAGVQSLVSNGDLISKVYFPREALPFADVAASLFDLAIGGVVLLVLILVQIGGFAATAFAALPAMVVLVLWTAAVTCLLATVAVFVRDFTHITRLLLQVGFFATPVMYSADLLPDWLRTIEKLNPLAVCIDALRDALLIQRWPDWPLLGAHAFAGAVLVVLAVRYTASVENRMVDVV